MKHFDGRLITEPKKKHYEVWVHLMYTFSECFKIEAINSSEAQDIADNAMDTMIPNLEIGDLQRVDRGYGINERVNIRSRTNE